MLLSKNDIISKYNISERTFDRYRKKLKFETFKHGRIIMFDENEIEKAMSNLKIISNKNSKKINVINTNNNYQYNENNDQIQKDKLSIINIEQDNVQKQDITNKYLENEYVNYLKNEIEYLKKELNEKNQMIESANYKVGKLETLVNLNNNILTEYESNKIRVGEMNIIISKQKDDIKSLKINFYIIIIFAFILILFEIYLFLYITKII